ncbi:hypothetical protein PTTG_10556 [Puccinia triticina 1-1 BBBD Race 1]|uniref:DUF4219 domain-containing protein n=1 Tax=Puccinia triticina (isolate 1-1 / race 1 (BBBD)) TaxID=630390 RepID=A0A0C4FBF8_PUCT1|nr:hypothetical protein PTTG_10556 [Puccinia triticina 1-1 BBBD Race 1]
MSDNSDSPYNNRSLIRVDKLTLGNWVQWKSQFTLYLKRHNLEELLNRKWVEDKKNAKSFKKKNIKALDLLYGAVSKDLHNEILNNDTSFLDAWEALRSSLRVPHTKSFIQCGISPECLLRIILLLSKRHTLNCPT